MNSKKLYEKWVARIDKAEKEYNDYHELIKEIRQYYKNECNKNKSNLFWSSIETLKPFLYFKAPKVYVDRKNKNSDPVEARAAQMLEKAIEWDLEQFDFDSVIKYARNDYLLSGCGVLIEKYVPTFKQIADIEGNVVDVVDSEKIETVYIDPVDFIADAEKVGIWENCTWVARVIDMTKREVASQFGKKISDAMEEDDTKENKNTKVYEIYDKQNKKILYICKLYINEVLKEVELPDLAYVLPMPKPIYTTQTNDSLIPVPDYVEIKSLLSELDGINNRMRLTMQALKISGCYDNAFPELANILDKDVTLVSLSDFDKLKEAGGIAGAIDFMPIQQYIDALAALAQQRQDVTAQIYEITGVSDIMRGNSDPNETATAVMKKTNFGTLRNQDRQNDMQRFITDLLKIKAEMICEMFQDETLLQFAGVVDETTLGALQLLRQDKTRNLIIGIETDTSFNQDNVAEKTLEAVKIVNDFVTQAFQVVSAQPALLPLYKQMIESAIITLPTTRQFEAVLDEVFNKIAQDLAQPEQPDAKQQETQAKMQAEMAKNQIQAQKNANDLAIKQEQNQIKREELAQKAQVDNEKLALTNKEMDAQIALKEAELAIKGNTNENVTTGFVGAF